MKNKFIIVILLIISTAAATFFTISSNYKVINVMNNKSSKKELNKEEMPKKYMDNGLFKNYYKKAYQKLKKMSQNEKISQILLIRYPEENQTEIIKKYQFGGYLFFAKDFKDKTKDDVIKMIADSNKVSKIPILTAVDEEGGIVVRVSSNQNLRSKAFSSPSELYKSGGFEKIKEDTIEKSNLLKSLGINLNLAPVVDVSTSPSDYMYKRSLQEDAKITAKFSSIVIETSKESGVSYTLKHFPGYGNNIDTHNGSSIDTRTKEEIENNDILPFKSGIKSKAEAILFSHNIVTSMDKNNPASLSKTLHDYLRNDLNFSGVIITDDLDMGAVKNIENKNVLSLLAGNDLLISTDYEESIKEIRNAIDNNTLDQETLDKHVLRVLAWKYYKKLL